jgi:hypothetical protein
MITLYGRHTEPRIPHLFWKLAWLAIFVAAKKSLIYWTDEV